MGTRLRDNSNRPKPLTLVLGLSLAERIVCTFQKDLGVRRFLVVVGYEAETVKAHFHDICAGRGVKVEFAEAEHWSLGNGASALAAKGLTGDSPFFLAMSDHLFDPEIGKMLIRHKPADGQACLAVDGNKNGNFDFDDVTRVKIKKGCIIEIAKSLDDWDAADTGLFLSTPGIFDGLERAAAKGLNGLSDGMRELARDKRAIAVDVTGHGWLDVDTPEALREAESRLLRTERGKTSDGPVSRLINRPISRWLTGFLVRTAITPNQISLVSWLLSVIAALTFTLGGYAALAVGGAIAQLASIIDGCDGEIARLKRMESEFGGWFDAVLDRYADAFLLFGLLWHTLPAPGDPTVLAIGFAAIVGAFMNSYTADKYDGLMARKLSGRRHFRLGRDVRVLVIFVGALLNQPLLILIVIAILTNAEVLRRIVLCRQATTS